MWAALSATYSGVEIQNSHGGWHVFSLDDAYVYEGQVLKPQGGRWARNHSGNSGTTRIKGCLCPAQATTSCAAPSNPYGIKDVDFLHTVLNEATSQAFISRVTAADFTGFGTDVGFHEKAGRVKGNVAVPGLRWLCSRNDFSLLRA